MSALAEHEARLRELLEANRQLVGAAQTAQKLQANAEDAHHRQINFVAMAAHALRNPLSAIRMASATLRHPRADEAMRALQHDVIQRQTAQMARLIDDLLDGSRVGAGEFRLAVQPRSTSPTSSPRRSTPAATRSTPSSSGCASSSARAGRRYTAIRSG